jgi:hypothetical protein
MKLRLKIEGMAAYQQLDTVYEMRLYFVALYISVGIVDTLLKRQKKHGPCGLVWIGVLGVTRYAQETAGTWTQWMTASRIHTGNVDSLF